METTMNPTMEQELEQSGAAMVKVAEGLVIANNEDFERGNAALKEIKKRIKAVKDYWQEPKAAADRAHKALVEREKQLLKPLQDAESMIKKAMLAYDAEVKRRQREAEEAARRAREEEEKRLAAMAAEAEKKGDSAGAAFMREMAEIVDAPEFEVQEAPVASGLSVRTTWKAKVVDPKLVPAYYDGYELREINMTMLNTLARLSEGGAKIPGVVFYTESTMSVRA